MSQSHVANAVGFLKQFDAGSLEALKAKYLGEAEQAMLKEALGPMSPLLKAQIEVTIAALQEFILAWSERSPHIRTRALRANTWAAIGSILASVGSGSALALLLSQSGPGAATLSTAVGLIGGLIGLADRYLKRDLYGGEGSLMVAYRNLSSGASTASALIRSLKPHLLTADTGEDQSSLEAKLEEANQLIGEMHDLLHSLPG